MVSQEKHGKTLMWVRLCDSCKRDITQMIARNLLIFTYSYGKKVQWDLCDACFIEKTISVLGQPKEIKTRL